MLHVFSKKVVAAPARPAWCMAGAERAGLVADGPWAVAVVAVGSGWLGCLGRAGDRRRAAGVCLQPPRPERQDRSSPHQSCHVRASRIERATRPVIFLGTSCAHAVCQQPFDRRRSIDVRGWWRRRVTDASSTGRCCHVCPDRASA